ncbi:MAG: hypothetical protein ABSD99_06635 [Candidatus Bathyarchaeia archaeon]
MKDSRFANDWHLIGYLTSMGMSKKEAEAWVEARRKGQSFKADSTDALGDHLDRILTDRWHLTDYLISMGMSKKEAEAWVEARRKGQSFKADSTDPLGEHLDRILTRNSRIVERNNTVICTVDTLLTNNILRAILLIVCLVISAQVYAGPQYAIPINGREQALVIGLQIQATPTWAHDVVLNASLVWNQAQVWYQQTSSSKGPVYIFVEAKNGSATVNFNMPQAYSKIAVGWTNFKWAPSSRIIIASTQTFLDPKVFNSSQENNATARQIAFWLALHELGRVLGLGSVLDSHDIMDPLWTPNRVFPMISILDIYALHILASGIAPTFVTLPSNAENTLLDARTFLTPGVNSPNPNA